MLDTVFEELSFLRNLKSKVYCFQSTCLLLPRDFESPTVQDDNIVG